MQKLADTTAADKTLLIKPQAIVDFSDSIRIRRQ